jgi:hypothetical protein
MAAERVADLANQLDEMARPHLGSLATVKSATLRKLMNREASEGGRTVNLHLLPTGLSASPPSWNSAGG